VSSSSLPKKVARIQQLHSEALLYLENGRVEKAISSWNSALKIAKKIEDWSMVTTFLLLIGQTNYAIEKYKDSLEILQEALRISRYWNKRNSECRILIFLGKVFDKLDQTKKAIAFFNDAKEIAKSLNDREMEADIFYGMGLVYRNQKHFQQSIDTLRRALKLYRRVKKQRDEAMVLFELAKSQRMMGDAHLSEALQSFEQSHRIARKIKDSRLTLEAAFQKADILFLLKRHDAALENFDRLLKQARKLESTKHLAHANYGKGKVLYEKGFYKEARPLFEMALKIFEVMQDQKNEAFCLTYLSNVFEKLDDQTMARRLKNQAKKKFKNLGIEITD